MSKIKVIQLEDKQGTPITPYTSASSVYLPDGTNLETQIGGMDINAIEAQQTSAMQEISDATTIALARIDEEQADDRAAINRLTCEVDNIDKNALPLDISYTITPNEGATSCDIYFAVSEYKGSVPALSSMVITKKSNSGVAKTIFNGTSYTGTVTAAIEGGKETFTFVAKTADKQTTIETVRYLVLCGTSEIADIEDVDICSFKKLFVGDSEFGCDISTADGEYIWMLIPMSLSIDEITHQSIDVTTTTPAIVDIENYGLYRAYRTVQPLADADWKLRVK